MKAYGKGFIYEFYKSEFQSKEQTLQFLRLLENKKIIKNYGNKTMSIPRDIWKVMIKNRDEIFKSLNSE